LIHSHFLKVYNQICQIIKYDIKYNIKLVNLKDLIKLGNEYYVCSKSHNRFTVDNCE